LKNYDNSFFDEAGTLALLRLDHRSLRICSLGAPSHRARRIQNLNRRSFSTDS
jgi:hypothetical protein